MCARGCRLAPLPLRVLHRRSRGCIGRRPRHGHPPPCRPQVAAVGSAERDSAAVAIEGPRFAGNVAVADEGAQVFGSSASRWPIVGTRLVCLGRIDSPQAISHAIDPERITINHADGLGKGWEGRKQEGSGQDGHFHRFWLARDYGENAAGRKHSSVFNAVSWSCPKVMVALYPLERLAEINIGLHSLNERLDDRTNAAEPLATAVQPAKISGEPLHPERGARRAAGASGRRVWGSFKAVCLRMRTTSA